MAQTIPQNYSTVAIIDPNQLTNGQPNSVAVSSAGGLGTSSTGSGATADQVQGNSAAGVADVGNPVKIGGKYNLAGVTLTDGQRGDAALNTKSQLMASVADGFGNPINSSGIATDGLSTLGTVLDIGAFGRYYNNATWDRVRGDVNGSWTVNKPVASGGMLSAKVLSAAGTNGVLVKSTAGQVYEAQFINTGSVVAYVKFYNKSTAPVPGTDVPVDIVGIPIGGRANLDTNSIGAACSAGIGYAITGGYLDTDTTAVLAGQVVGSIKYF